MPVIASLPTSALAPEHRALCRAAAPTLAAAGWQLALVDPDEGDVAGKIGAALQQGRDKNCDVLAIGAGAGIYAAMVLAELCSARSHEVAIDVALAIAPPSDILAQHVARTVAAGSVTPPDQALTSMLAAPESVPDLMRATSISRLVETPRVRVHAIPMARLKVPVLVHLFRDILGLKDEGLGGNSAFGMRDPAPEALLRADSMRLISIILQRDFAVADGTQRGLALARVDGAECSALMRLIRAKAEVARRTMRLRLPNVLCADVDQVTNALEGRWTLSMNGQLAASADHVDLTFHDCDAMLSVGAIADAANSLADELNGRTGNADPGNVRAARQASSLSDGAGAQTSPQSKLRQPDGLPAPQPLVAKRPGTRPARANPSGPEKTSGPAHQTATPRLLVLGHSHIGALDLAWAADQKRFGNISYHSAHLNAAAMKPNFHQQNRRRAIAPDFCDLLSQVIQKAAPDLIVALPMGNEYNAAAMTPVGPPFEFFTPGEMAIPTPGVWQLSYAIMRAQITALAERNALLILAAIADASACPVIALPPPPPIFDEAHIRANPGRFVAAIAESGLNPPGLRARIWALYVDVLGQALAAARPQLMPLPENVFEVREGQRFLAKDLWAQDPTHANGHYGAILLDAIVAHLPAKKASAA